MIIDLSQTTFCDSSGVRVLLRAWQQARADGGELILIGIGRQVARTLHILAVRNL